MYWTANVVAFWKYCIFHWSLLSRYILLNICNWGCLYSALSIFVTVIIRVCIRIQCFLHLTPVRRKSIVRIWNDQYPSVSANFTPTFRISINTYFNFLLVWSTMLQKLRTKTISISWKLGIEYQHINSVVRLCTDNRQTPLHGTQTNLLYRQELKFQSWCQGPYKNRVVLFSIQWISG
jgi:hypothetical protein